MKTQKTLNENIFRITTTIRNECPELMKFLNEMPITIPYQKSPEINNDILEEYFNSLKDLLMKYAPNHPSLLNNF